MLPDIASQAREQESQAGSPNTSHSSVRHVVVERLQNLLVTVLVSYSSDQLGACQFGPVISYYAS